jgi:cyclic pyranopterin phosphate synthase
VSVPIESPRDTLRRPLHDLRISVTDRCNFRCVYCMPKEIFGRDHVFLPRQALLTFEELERAARLFADLGVAKIRLTGGEPLLRRGLEQLVAMLARLPGIELTMTTNGSLLKDKARVLRDAGLQRVSVSLDAIDDATFMKMNDVDFPVQRVLEGIDAAVAAGLTPVKVNMVVKRGINEHSILPMAEYFRGRGIILRFIEYMDVGTTNGWRLDQVVPAAEVQRILNAVHPLEPVEPNYRGEVANRYRYRDGAGEIGLIASVSQPFCGDCSRVRLSADGQVFLCLFAALAFDLRQRLRSGVSDEELSLELAGLWHGRDDRYSEIRSGHTAGVQKVEMSYIGG